MFRRVSQPCHAPPGSGPPGAATRPGAHDVDTPPRPTRRTRRTRRRARRRLRTAPSPSPARRRRRRGGLRALAGTLAAVGPASPAAADAPLAGSYVGQVNGDFGSVAGLTMDISGPATAVNAWTTIGDGARIDCHGNQAVGFRQLNLTGARSAVNADGTADYELLGRFEFDSTVHVVVDLGVHGHLSADGTSFNGTVDVRVKPTIGSACYRTVVVLHDQQRPHRPRRHRLGVAGRPRRDRRPRPRPRAPGPGRLHVQPPEHRLAAAPVGGVVGARRDRDRRRDRRPRLPPPVPVTAAVRSGS